MDRTKLAKKFKKEITLYLGIPYFINTPQNPYQKLNAQVGKGNRQQIKKYSQRVAQKENINFDTLTPLQRYRFQKKHHIGIDCSGLAYHLVVDFLYKTKYNQSIRPHLVGTQNKDGPRKISAHLLTSPPNATPVTDRQKTQIGDLLRTNKGKHVLIIYKKTKNKIYYIHSSPRHRGVRTGIITISKFPPDHKVFRLKCLTSLPPVPGT